MTAFALVFSLEKNIPNIELTNNPTKQITTITITATQPPATIAAINAFVPAMIAFIADIVAFTANLIPCAVLFAVSFAICAALLLALTVSFAVFSAFFAASLLVLIAVLVFLTVDLATLALHFFLKGFYLCF